MSQVWLESREIGVIGYAGLFFLFLMLTSVLFMPILIYRGYHVKEAPMPMKVKVNKIICMRCSHQWTPRGTVVQRCPGCNSELFNKALTKEERKKRDGDIDTETE